MILNLQDFCRGTYLEEQVRSSIKMKWRNIYHKYNVLIMMDMVDFDREFES